MCILLHSREDSSLPHGVHNLKTNTRETTAEREESVEPGKMEKACVIYFKMHLG